MKRWQSALAALLAMVMVCGALMVGASAAGTNSLPYEIKVNRKMNTVTVYTQDEAGNYTVPYKAMICSTGRLGHATLLGSYSVTSVKKEWCLMFDGTYGQYSTQFFGNYLFHSICYTAPDPATMLAQEYNMLGGVASLGCVRLQTADAKWIYDNCAPGTRVTIYDGDDPGPLGKPERAVDVVPADCGWDPTDPRVENPWTQVPVEEIQLSQEELELQAGDTAALEAVCLPEDAGVKSVTWESSAPEVASVYGGRVVGLDEGTAVITAKCGKAASSCTVTVTGELLPFSDLAAGAWYYDDMRFATAKELLNGTGDGHMEPSGLVSWPAALQIVYNLAGRPGAKSEIPNWYGEALAWAQDNGLLDGLTFDTEKAVGRAEMVTLLYRFVQKKNQKLTTDTNLEDFADADTVPAYAQEAARWAVEQGILKGDENQNLNLLTSLTRAQIAALLRRYLEK